MPIHDWTRVPSGLFHHFHQDWSIEIARTLNRGHLPKGFSALVEQRAGPREGSVLSIEGGQRPGSGGEHTGSVATMEPPVTRIIRSTAKRIYSDRANRILVKHHLGQIVAVIEILSPGNKESRAAVRDFVEKTIDFLRTGIHALVIDLFPPTRRDPCGIHKVIWDEILEEDFDFPAGKDRILVSYNAGPERVAYIEPVAVGDPLPDMPLFLTYYMHVKVPLELTYQATWDASPEEMRRAVETGVMPEPEAKSRSGAHQRGVSETADAVSHFTTGSSEVKCISPCPSAVPIEELSHAPSIPPRLYADRVVGRRHRHGDPDRPVAPGRAKSARGGCVEEARQPVTVRLRSADGAG